MVAEPLDFVRVPEATGVLKRLSTGPSARGTPSSGISPSSNSSGAAPFSRSTSSSLSVLLPAGAAPQPLSSPAVSIRTRPAHNSRFFISHDPLQYQNRLVLRSRKRLPSKRILPNNSSGVNSKSRVSHDKRMTLHIAIHPCGHVPAARLTSPVTAEKIAPSIP